MLVVALLGKYVACNTNMLRIEAFQSRPNALEGSMLSKGGIEAIKNMHRWETHECAEREWFKRRWFSLKCIWVDAKRIKKKKKRWFGEPKALGCEC